MKSITIAIDGFSSCGKSTLAKALAKELGFTYMDSGAMYRSVSLYIKRSKIPIDELSSKEVKEILDGVQIDFKWNRETMLSETFLNGENVENEIRGKEVSDTVSKIAQNKNIRAILVERQREMAKGRGVVMDGRDIGTKVFPKADVKLFMTAEPAIRAERRYSELKAKGDSITLEEVIENIRLRDYNDSTRKENPLRKADDAIEIDNSFIGQEEQLGMVLKMIHDKI